MESTPSVLDYSSAGSLLLLQTFACFDSFSLVYGMCRSDSLLPVLDFLNSGSLTSLQTFARLGPFLLAFGVV